MSLPQPLISHPHTTMSKPKKKDLKVYTISETIFVSYQVVATSEEDAQNHYRNLPNDEWQTLLEEGASNNYCDDEVTNEEDYSPEEHSFIDKTDAAKEISK